MPASVSCYRIPRLYVNSADRTVNVLNTRGTRTYPWLECDFLSGIACPTVPGSTQHRHVRKCGCSKPKPMEKNSPFCTGLDFNFQLGTSPLRPLTPSPPHALTPAPLHPLAPSPPRLLTPSPPHPLPCSHFGQAKSSASEGQHRSVCGSAEPGKRGCATWQECRTHREKTNIWWSL